MSNNTPKPYELTVVTALNDHRYGYEVNAFLTREEYKEYLMHRTDEFLAEVIDADEEGEVRQLVDDGKIEDAFARAEEIVDEAGWEKTEFGYYTFEEHKLQGMQTITDLAEAARKLLAANASMSEMTAPLEELERSLAGFYKLAESNSRL